MIIWLTGLPCSGKTTIGRELTRRLEQSGYRVEFLDGDAVRRTLWSELKFTRIDRDENVLRFGQLAAMFARHNIIVVVAVVSPYRSARDSVRLALAGKAVQFFEIYCSAPVEVCERRDVKGMYRQARAGSLPHFTGLDDPYEAPLAPDVTCPTHRESIAESVDRIILKLNGALKPFKFKTAGEGI
jgi:adenylyl-sulfate kinase